MIHDEASDALSEDAERARIRNMLLRRGVPPAQITERLIDFWIGQDARDQEEARRLGIERPHRGMMGSGG